MSNEISFISNGQYGRMMGKLGGTFTGRRVKDWDFLCGRERTNNLKPNADLCYIRSIKLIRDIDLSIIKVSKDIYIFCKSRLDKLKILI